MKIKRIDVLTIEAGNEFKINDIVEIRVGFNFPRSYIGRLISINSLDLALDYSCKYQSKIIKIKFEDISKIILFK